LENAAKPKFWKGDIWASISLLPGAYLCHEQGLEAIKNGRYKTHPTFAQYMRALEKAPMDNNIIQGRSAYFEKFPSIFFTAFCSMFD
jgi:hypothetical protein